MRIGKIWVHIHPSCLFCFIFFAMMNRLWLFVWIFGCLSAQEAGKWICLCVRQAYVKRLLFTPLGIRVDWIETTYITRKEQVCIFFAGTATGILLAAVLFMLEMRIEAGVCMAAAMLRLLPVLPLDGGWICLAIASHRYGILRTASCLTKMGRGAGYGCIVFGMAYCVLFPLELGFLMIGKYILYVNRHVFGQITARFYHQLLNSSIRRGGREIIVTGRETPADLLELLNPFTRTLFSEGYTEAITQERVLTAFFNGKDTSWLWRPNFQRKACKFHRHPL